MNCADNQTTASENKNMNRTFFRRSLAVFLGGTLLLTGSGLVLTRLVEAKENAPAVRVVVDDTPINREGKFITSFAPVVKKAAPSVVNVFTTTHSRQLSAEDMPNRDMFRRFFEDPLFRGRPDLPGQPDPRMRTPRQSGLGSGVIVTEDGYILTNNHVVDNADSIRVALQDGREFEAQVVGKDPKTDIAVLKVEATGLPYVTMADSSRIEIGDLVLALGNPFGIGQTVTMGMVSATGRATMGIDYEDFIQTDAAINPGNSGGALVDAEGRLIGINTAILSRSGGNNGIGFAIPVNLARYVMTSLVEHGRVIRGFLGVMIQNVTPALAKEFDMDKAEGALVAEVTPNSAAAKAGIEGGDVIVEFNNRAVLDSRQFRLTVAEVPPGTKVPVKVLRNGKERTLEVTLKELPGAKELAQGNSSSQSDTEYLKGITVSDLDSATRERLDIPVDMNGALITHVELDSPAYEAGLRPGDVIREINRASVSNAAEAAKLSGDIKDPTILLRVWSKGQTRFVVVDESRSG